jgi:hypothetical protein
MVSKNHAGDLDLFDRGRTRRHSLSPVASANQLPAHSAGNFQQQSEQKSRAPMFANRTLMCALRINRKNINVKRVNC